MVSTDSQQEVNTNAEHSVAAEAVSAEPAKASPQVAPPSDERAAGGFIHDGLSKAVVECLIFASEKPISASKLAELANVAAPNEQGKLDGRTVRRIIDQLRQEYDAQGRAFQIEEIADGFRMFTRPEYHQWVKAMAVDRQQAKLSPAAIETLAIVAYKQPITRAHIEDIRGVQAGPMLRTLLEKRLVKVVGRENVPGRPLLYGTSKEFLDHFGLKAITDLPTIKELPRPA